MTGSLAVKVCMTASFHSWQSLAIPSCSVGKPQILWHPQGVPRVQYVNAKAADDEWPPKYWKVIAYRWLPCHSGCLCCLRAFCVESDVMARSALYERYSHGRRVWITNCGVYTSSSVRMFLHKNLQVQLEMEGGVRTAFCDPRRFGRVKQSADVAADLAHLGFDPLLSMPALEAFEQMLGKERRGIKALLLDQARAQTLLTLAYKFLLQGYTACVRALMARYMHVIKAQRLHGSPTRASERPPMVSMRTLPPTSVSSFREEVEPACIHKACSLAHNIRAPSLIAPLKDLGTAWRACVRGSVLESATGLRMRCSTRRSSTPSRRRAR